MDKGFKTILMHREQWLAFAEQNLCYKAPYAVSLWDETEEGTAEGENIFDGPDRQLRQYSRRLHHGV